MSLEVTVAAMAGAEEAMVPADLAPSSLKERSAGLPKGLIDKRTFCHFPQGVI
jgi:hypothetical protein